MKKVLLSKGKIAIVDNEDFLNINKYKWCYSSFGYAVRNEKKGSKRTNVYMHRIILKTPKGKETDHINGDRLDNRKENLRVCTRAQNNRNAALRKDNSSGYKGVSLDKRYNTWMARIRFNNIRIYLGNFATEKLAANAYKKASLIYHGQYARIINNN